ncbi:hypothetical protein tloyanaT_29050 [Thalassotalea loyana]|uniref:Uncharacterized protein n=1 Tax=Thalassotalea loyana TaxID=280483 RepID=A0ABQ6HEW3_9GAMM|nr:polysialyltransferase family glycosyltransferase [Thalassotalea loyana]GLX86652.1 hypothetical protein tloyanaT_29050 [Thalassotalea loyana]
MVTNVFIAFTQAQVVHAVNVITTQRLQNVVIISRYQCDEYNEFFEHVFILDGPIYRLLFKWLKVKNYLKSIGKVNLFIAHSLNVFSQGVFHELLDNNFLNTLNVFPDGNLLFNDFTVNKYCKDNLVKKLASYVIGAKYRLFSGSVISPFVDIDTVHSYIDGVTCKYRALKYIDVTPVTKNIGTGVLILGHRNQQVISADSLIEVVKRNITEGPIYYKPHPRLAIENDLFYQILNVSFKGKVSLIDNKSPIEVIIQDFPIQSVFAVASSSLVTLKILIPEVNVCYFGLQRYLGKHYNPQMKIQFDRMGLIEWN